MNYSMNQNNWAYSSYRSEKLQAFISFGGESKEDEDKEMIFYYLVTVTNYDFKEIIQQEHIKLEDALAFINERYGHWAFTPSRAEKKEEGGCGSCSAH